MRKQEFQNPFDPPLDQPPLPHRGALTLFLGILGFFTMGITGAIAWYLGNQDLRQINAGLMEAKGSDLTGYGRIIGIFTVILALLAIVVKAFLLLSAEMPPI